MTTGATDDPAFRMAFWTARHSIFRLESDRGLAGDPNFNRWRRGEPWQQTDSKAYWVDMVASRRAEGVAMERVKVVGEPWSAPAEYLLTVSFPHNVEAGEQISVLRLGDDGQTPDGVPSGADFWLFDDAALWWLDYDPAGTVTAVRRVSDAATLLMTRRARRAALAHSTLLYPYLAQRGVRLTA